MLHPSTELRKVSDEVGFGVFATQFIPKGTITWALDPLDQVLNTRRSRCVEDLAGHTLMRYTWVNGAGKRILCWDFARFMNHSCAPNSLSPGGFELEIAIRDIAADEEITSDYGTLNLEEPLECRCGAANCRGTILPADFEELVSVWDEHIRGAFPHLRQVPQPLWSLVAKHAKALERYVRRPDHIPSILKHRWPPGQLAMTPRAASTGR